MEVINPLQYEHKEQINTLVIQKIIPSSSTETNDNNSDTFKACHIWKTFYDHNQGNLDISLDWMCELYTSN